MTVFTPVRSRGVESKPRHGHVVNARRPIGKGGGGRYNRACLRCAHDCKQSADVKIVSCPQYEEEK